MIVRNSQVKKTKTRTGNIEANFMEELFLEYAQDDSLDNFYGI
jgi:hypothetical protein